MKRALSIILILLGLAALAFGLLFIVGAGGRLSRYVIAGLGLGLGALCLGFGARLARKLQMRTSAYIRAEVLALASRHNGELSQADLQAQLGERFPDGVPVLAQLQQAGLCRQTEREGKTFYVFPDMQPRLTIRKCEFCDAELPLDEQLSSCPNCGGSIKTRIERLSLSKDEAYSMDE
ncbi:MAG: hypothetical protein JRF33_18460 [Deltaproteobacteria bacterium]|nr:hypothetical protein [Deltaproteobacteria bacterium]